MVSLSRNYSITSGVEYLLFSDVFLAIGIKPLANCLSFAKLLMYHRSSALIKLVQSRKPHKALRKTGPKSAELFLNTTYLL